MKYNYIAYQNDPNEESTELCIMIKCSKNKMAKTEVSSFGSINLWLEIAPKSTNKLTNLKIVQGK